MPSRSPNQLWMTRSARASRWIGATVFVVGFFGLLGWWANIGFFRTIATGLAPMKPNTALGLMLCGTALAVGIVGSRARRIRMLCGGLSATLGGATLAEYIFITSDLIDSWLIGGPGAGVNVRMTPGAALGLTCAGLASILTAAGGDRAPWRKVCEVSLSLIVMLIGTLALLGYLYGVRSLYSTAVFSTMAVHTALMFALTGLGLLLSRPDQGLAKLAGSRGAGGVMARRLLAFFVILAPLLGWLRLKGQEAGWYDTPFGLAILVTTMMVVGVAMVWSTARELDRADSLRSALQEDLAASVSREHATAAQRGSILNALPGGIALLDIDGRVVALNKRWKSLRPVPVETGETSGMPFVEWVGGVLGADEESLVAVAAGVNAVLHGGQSRHLSELRVKPPGASAGSAESMRWLEVRIAPVLTLTGSRAPGAQGEPTGAVVMVSDVTERHRMEEQLVNAQRLEAVGRLAGGVAHDFNNLLTAVTGHRALAQAALESGRSAQQNLDAIEQAARSGAELTQQLLAFGRRQVLAPKVVAVDGLINNVRRLIEQSLGEQIRLSVVTENDLWPTRVDPGRIEQVLINLVINAKDAITRTGAGAGSVIIETTNAILDERYAESRVGVAPGQYVCLTVSDTGVGMSGDVMARLFEPFFTTKERGTGSGLGLATSFGIVKQHGGHIAAYSEQGCGSTFRVYLPAAKGETVEPRQPPAAKAIRGTEHILLVDDHAGARAAIAGMLRQLGYTVTEAQDGATAVQTLRTMPHDSLDLLVCDVMLPDGTGPEVARILRAQDGWSDLPVLFISGYTANAIVHHGVLDKGVQFLAKPFTMDELGVKIRDVLKHPAE